jgi:Cytochrome c554 and c-prime
MSLMIVAAVLTVAGVTILDASAGAPPALPGPAPRNRTEGVAQDVNDGCVGCHQDVADEWKASAHAHSFDDPVFLSAYAVEPTSFCSGCHAPESQLGALDDARAIGVGCVTCHVEGGSIVNAQGAKEEEGGHPVLGDARMATVSACANCHDFDFPRHPGSPMQGTVREHRESTLARTTCESCHMPRVGGDKGHLSHRFGVRDLLPSAVRASARREPGGVVVVTLSANRPHERRQRSSRDRRHPRSHGWLAARSAGALRRGCRRAKRPLGDRLPTYGSRDGCNLRCRLR